MKKTIIILSLLFLSGMTHAQDFTNQIEQNNKFSFDLYSYVSNTDKNFFISPFSVSTALAMTYEGAADKTRKEMAEVMHFAWENEKMNKSFNEIISRVKSSKDAEHYTLNIANSIWAQQDFEFLQSFFNTIEKYYDAPINTADFKDQSKREETRKLINKWTEEKTNNKIKDLLDQNALDYDTKMVLVNAVYFLAQWKKAFDEKATKEGVFRTSDGELKKDFMKQSNRLRYVKSDSVQFLEIPYQDEKASMVIIIPDKPEQFTDFQKTINYEYYKSLAEKAEYTNIELYLPKFKIEYNNDLKKILYDAGMKRAFSDKAEFWGMVCKDKEALKIDKIIHQTFINVDEAGTEAAAATAVIMKRVTSVNPNDKIIFKADRPFIFLIKENTTGSILFTGRLIK